MTVIKMCYGYKIQINENGNEKYIICKTLNETILQLEYYLKFPPYVKNRTIRIFDITKKEVKDGIFDKLPWREIFHQCIDFLEFA
ncbi:MAG: hypothetical protein SPL13_01080 [Clostridia bacterium]|nr:hypothetical protein [Clostridia bacterium]